jgi:hypothetical protein
MSRIDGTSWNNKRPRGVPETLQVSQHIVECQRDDTSNVFTNDPSGSAECNDFAHRRPEVAVVSLGALLSCLGEGLAREATADEIDSSKPTQSACIKGANVLKAGDIRPVLGKDCSAELVSLAEGNRSHSRSLESKAETSNAAEEIEDIH